MIELKPLSEGEWEKATAAMASKAVFAVRLLSWEMPQNIEEAFSDSGISLFPKNCEDLMTDCCGERCLEAAGRFTVLLRRCHSGNLTCKGPRGVFGNEIKTLYN